MSLNAEEQHIALEPVHQQEISRSKPQVETTENIQNDPRKFIIGSNGGDVALELINDVDDLLEPFTAEEERKVMRKVDWLILPYLALCYVFFFVCYCPAQSNMLSEVKTHLTQHQWSRLTRLRCPMPLFLAFPTT